MSTIPPTHPAPVSPQDPVRTPGPTPTPSPWSSVSAATASHSPHTQHAPHTSHTSHVPPTLPSEALPSDTPHVGPVPPALPPEAPGVSAPPTRVGSVPWATPGPTPPWTPWAPQHPAPAPPAGHRRALAVLLVVLAALGVAGGAYAVTRGDGTPSPEQAVLDYRRAAERRDCAAVIDFLTDGFLAETLGATRQEALADCDRALEVENATIDSTEVLSQDGDRAVVEATWTSEASGDVVSRFELVLEDGRWRAEDVTDRPA
jgi:hypothetical protein